MLFWWSGVSYEVRLAKYAERGFEVHVPNLKRADIDPTVIQGSMSNPVHQTSIR